MDKKTLIQSALATAIAIGATSYAIAADKAADMEKCYGIAKAHMNDCGNVSHSCSGQSDKDANAGDWIYVAKGSCNKIVGGSLTAPGDKKAEAPATTTTTGTGAAGTTEHHGS